MSKKGAVEIELLYLDACVAQKFFGGGGRLTFRTFSQSLRKAPAFAVCKCFFCKGSFPGHQIVNVLFNHTDACTLAHAFCKRTKPSYNIGGIVKSCFSTKAVIDFP